MRQIPSDTTAFPTRQFNFILDPKHLEDLRTALFREIFIFIQDLKNIAPPIDIQISLPTYLADESAVRIESTNYDQCLNYIDRRERFSDFVLDELIQEDIRNELNKRTDSALRILELLALSNALKADGIITNEKLLIEGRYSIYQYHRIRIIPVDEFADIVEIIAHGHGIFWSVASTIDRLNLDLFYILTHRKSYKLSIWFDSIKKRILNIDVNDNLRSAIFNRYPYILYSRDMIKFYELQKEYSTRRDRIQNFAISLGYYVTVFYLLLWGMLDQLTVIAKYSHNLDLGERDCGIQSRKFWKQFGLIEPKLKEFIRSEKIAKWISIMADIRHHAAHKSIKIPAEVVQDTPESTMSDEEILKIIREEKGLLYDIMSDDFLKHMESQLVFHWRVSKMKRLAPSMVFIKDKKGKGYMWDPVISVDHDLSMLNAIMDAFLIRLFRDI